MLAKSEGQRGSDRAFHGLTAEAGQPAGALGGRPGCLGRWTRAKHQGTLLELASSGNGQRYSGRSKCGLNLEMRAGKLQLSAASKPQLSPKIAAGKA